MYPEISIEAQNIPHSEYTYKLQLMFASKNAPDILDMNLNQNFDFFSAKGVLEDLKPYIEEKPGDLRIGEFNRAVIQRVSPDGAMYMLPVASHPGIAGLAYNLEMFDAIGLDYPDETWTYDDLLNAAQALTLRDDSGRISQYGLIAPNKWVGVTTALESNGGGWISADGRTSLLMNDASLETYTWLAELIHKHQVSPRTDQMVGNDPLKSFLSGQSGMYFFGAWEIGKLKTAMAEGNTAAAAPVPLGKKGRIPSGANMDSFAMSSMGRNKDGAWAFLSWLGSEKMLYRVIDNGLGIPPLLSVYRDEAYRQDPFFVPFLDALLSEEYGNSPIPGNFRVGEMRNTIEQGLDPLWVNPDMDVEEIVSQVHRALQEVLDKPAPDEF